MTSVTNEQRPAQPGPHAKLRTRTHIRLGILVGAGIQQQPRAVRVTLLSGPDQRRLFVLRARFSLSRRDIRYTHAHIRRGDVRNHPWAMTGRRQTMDA